MYTIKFKSSVEKDLQKIDRKAGEKILSDIKKKLIKDPRAGIPLKGNHHALWRFRSGNYRVIYTFNDDEVWILVLQIAHRKEVYRNL